VRYSGTEPLLRVMVEGECDDTIREVANRLVDVVKTHLG
jgi:phosphoglucosamine mutase